MLQIQFELKKPPNKVNKIASGFITFFEIFIHPINFILSHLFILYNNMHTIFHFINHQHKKLLWIFFEMQYLVRGILCSSNCLWHKIFYTAPAYGYQIANEFIIYIDNWSSRPSMFNASTFHSHLAVPSPLWLTLLLSN